MSLFLTILLAVLSALLIMNVISFLFARFWIARWLESPDPKPMATYKETTP